MKIELRDLLKTKLDSGDFWCPKVMVLYRAYANFRNSPLVFTMVSENRPSKTLCFLTF
jgi:hypothetical protein